MKKRVGRKLSFVVALFLLMQVFIPAMNVFAAETNNNMLPPSNLAYQNVTPTDIKLTWSAVFGATGYKVYEITDGQLIVRGTSTTTSFAVNGLQEGSYTYAVSTLSPDGESGPSAPITADIVYPDMTAPVLSAAIQNGNDIVLNWTASPNAQSYNLYQVQADGQKTLVKTQTTRTFTIVNAPAGTYTYAVTSFHAVYGESPLSAPAEVPVVYPVMAAPGNLTFTVTNATDVNLKWNAASYATGYNVYQIVDGQKVLKTMVTGTAASFANQPAGDYVYEVNSVSSRFGESPEGSRITVTVGAVVMAAPGNLSSKIQNVNDIVLTWSPVTYANSYKIYQVVDGQIQLKSTVTATTVTFANQPAGDYLYEVHAYSDRFGESPEGSQTAVTLGSVTMAPPATITYKLQNLNDIVLTWGTAANADSYKIYQIVDGQKVLKSTLTGLTVTYANQPAGDYVFEVHSFSARFGESAEGKQVSFTVDAVIMAPPATFTYKLQNLNDIVLTWGTSANANSYKIYQVVNGQKVLKSTIAGTTVTYANQPAGDYVFEVHSFSTRYGESPDGTQVAFTIGAVTMEPPVNLAYNFVNNNDIVLSWTASANANNYKVYLVANGQKTLKSTVTGTTVTYVNQAAGDYTFEVHAYSDRFGESAEGSQVSFTLGAVVMAAPANFQYKLQNGNDIVLTWDTAANANSYKVYLVANGQKTLKSTVTGTTVTYANQPKGDYTYEVHSFSTRYGESPEGSSVAITLVFPIMEPPANVVQTVKNATDFTLSWDASAYATSYKVYQIVGGQKVLKSTVTGLSVTYTGMSPGEYTYEVHSVSTRFGESPEGTLLTMTLNGQVMQAPANPTYSVANGNDITLRWTAVTYATSYKIYQVVDGQKVLKSTVTGTSATYTNQPEGTYDFEIHSVSTILGESPEGADITFDLVFPTVAAPATLTTKIQNGNDVVLTWTAVTYGNSYKVYELVDGQEVLKSTATALTVTLSNVSGGEHTYIVHAVSNRFGESPEGKQAVVTLNIPIMQAPGNFTKSVANGNDITLRWNAVTYATAYKLYQVVNGEEVLVKSQTGTTVTFTNQPEGDYTYIVRSYSDRYGESPEDSELPFSLVWPTMQAPGGFTQTIANGNDVTLKWNAVTYASGYKLYQIVDGQEVLLKNQTGLTVTFTNQPEADYAYVVRSYSSRFGDSPEGSELRFTLTWPVMQAPGNLTKTIANGNDVTLKWNATPYTTNYRVYQVVDGQKVLKSTLTGTTVTYANMPAGNLNFVVHSYSSRFGESPVGSISEFELVWPVVQPPVLTDSVFNANNITLSWPAVTWANEYRVYDVSGDARQMIYKGTALSFKVYNLSEDTHRYEVTAFSNRFGESEPSNRVSETIVFPIMQPPAASVKLLSNTSARISWNFITYANGYNVYEIVDGKPVLLIQNLNNLSYTVSDLPYKNHEYYVTSYSNSFGESEPSNTVLAKLIVDTEAPVTQAEAPAGWTNDSAVVTFTATDNETGVANTYYSLNDGEYAAGTSVEVTEEGVNKVSFYSVDKVGNTEAVRTIEVKIDRTAPVTQASEIPAWFTQKAELKFTASDALSGVAQTYYSLNGSAFAAGNSVTIEDDGVYQVQFYSVDLAGNKEAPQTVEVKIDRTAPVTVPNAPEAWSQDKVDVTLTASDTQSGVEKTFYSVNGSDYQEGTTLAVEAEGINKISFYSVDQAGNKETARTIEVKIDRTAPVTVADTPEAWVKEALIHFTATDGNSGVAKTYFAVNGSDDQEGTSVQVDAEGINKISFYSVDQAGNKETARTIEVKIDRTAPVTVSDAPAGWVTKGVTVHLASKDASSGVAQSFYSVDGAPYAEGSSVGIDAEGVHDISFYSVDAAGNIETANKAAVKIDKTAPVVTLNLNQEYQAGTTLKLAYAATDTGSGVASEKLTVTRPDGTVSEFQPQSVLTLDKPGTYTVTVTVTDAAGLSTTVTKTFVAFLSATISVTPNVIKGNKGVFTVRVDLPNGFSTQGFDLDTATLNGVRALNSNNGYYNQAKNGQFKFERSDFNWTASEVALHFRGYVNGVLVMGQTTVKVQK